jgi:hypothetical protein
MGLEDEVPAWIRDAISGSPLPLEAAGGDEIGGCSLGTLTTSALRFCA